MSENTSTGAGAAPAAGTGEPPAGSTTGGQAPPAGSGQAPASGTQSGSDGETPEQLAARLTRELADARKEAAGYRTKAKEYEDAQAAAAAASLSDLERAQKAQKDAEAQAAALQAQLRDQATRSAAVAAATKLNFRNPELAHRLLDASALEWDDASGQPKNVEALLRDVAKAEPYLVKGAGQDFGGGNRGGQPDGQPGMNELLRAAWRG